MKKNVCVGLSGGVDSSVTAYLLQEAGYEVFGIMMYTYDESRCCDMSSVLDAHDVAKKLNIPFEVIDYRPQFNHEIVDHFIESYEAGLTPNPCVKCNAVMRFSLLWETAHKMGADYLSTGHYARVTETNGHYKLLRGIDPEKDQSYMLSQLSQEQLSRALFPLGDKLKTQTRQIAEKAGLITSHKSDSQDLCFLPHGIKEFFERKSPQILKKGDIVNNEGKKLGTHDGLPLYTIGQRTGLGIASSEKLYISEIDTQTNTITLSPKDAVMKNSFNISQVNNLSTVCCDSFSADMQIRYHGRPIPAQCFRSGEDRMTIVLSIPNSTITPGQVAVGYRGDEVLFSGVIDK